MRKLTKWSVNLGVVTIALLVLMVALVSSLALAPSSGVTAEAALTEGTVANLGGNGLVLGNNNVAVNNDNFYVEANDNTGTSSFSNNQLKTTGNVKVVTKPMVKIGDTSSTANLDQTALVYYGLRDADVVTTFRFECRLSAMNIASTFDIALKVYYSNNNSTAGIPVDPSGAIDPDTLQPAQYVINDSITVDPQTTWTATQSIEVEISGAQIPTNGAHFHVEIEMNSASTEVTVDRATVLVTAAGAYMGIDTNQDVSLTINGANRTEVVLNNVLKNKEQLANVYVKEGDVISIRTSVEKYSGDEGSSKQEYGRYFAAALGRMRKSCIDWHTYSDAGYGTNNTYLTQTDTNIYYPEAGSFNEENAKLVYYGYSITFVVGANVANAKSVSIIPRFISSYNGANYEYWNLDDPSRREASTITINVDGTRPSVPLLDTTVGLGKTVNDKEWYTDSSSITLTYQENANMGLYGVADEQVYAFIVDKDYVSYVGEYDFTPGDVTSNPKLTYKIGTETREATRQQLGDYSNDSRNKNKLTFDLHGEFGLVLFAVDSAGNVSTPAVYSANTQRGTVKVDSRSKGAGIFIRYQDETITPMPGNDALQNFTKYANVYVYAGPQYHSEDGTCKQPAGNFINNLNANRNLVLVKRGQWVTVRIVMDSTQTYEYSLVRVSLEYVTFIGNGFDYEGTTTEGERVYTFTFFTNDELWSKRDASDNIAIQAFFHRRVEIKLLENDFTFTYDRNSLEAKNITINENAANLKAFFPDGSEPVQQPKIDVVYYKPISITIHSEYRIGSTGAIFLEGDAVIYVDGVRYELLNNTIDLTAFGRGEIAFETGTHSYRCDSKTLSNAYYTEEEGRSLYCFDITGYDEKAPSQVGFKDAGEYYFLATVKDGSTLNYYGELFSTFTIKKADPQVINPFVVESLTYGQGLDEISFASYDYDNITIIKPEGNNALTIGTNTYVRVSSNLFGRFVIVTPAIGDNDYNTPPVNDRFPLEVHFIPVDLAVLTQSEIRANWSVLSNFFDTTTTNNGALIYVLKDGMRSATNYNEVIFTLYVTVGHKETIVYADNDALNFEYDGYEKNASASAYVSVNGSLELVEDVPFIFEYKSINEGNGSYVKVAPTNAGDYNVRITVDSSRCNYKSEEPAVAVLRITKRVLEVNVKEGTENHTIIPSTIVSGITTNEMLTYTYSHAQTPSFVTGYTDANGVFNQVPGILFSYSFFNYEYYTHSFSTTATDEDLLVSVENPTWGEKQELIGASYLNAGRYLMAVTVENDNNQGTKYIIVDVKQVRTLDKASLTINSPSTQTYYEAVGLNGSSPGKTAHLEFGQTLQSVQSKILSGGGANYVPRGATNAISIPSRFNFETEEAYLSRILQQNPQAKLEVNGYGEYVLPVLFDASGKVTSHALTIYWQAGVYEGDTFVPNYNFRTEAIPVSITVARATPDFSAYTLSDITYGQTIGEASFQGVITSYGYEFKAEDFTIEVPEANRSFVPNGGLNNVRCVFTPSAELQTKYLTLDNAHVALNVLKRKVDIAFELSTVQPEDFNGAQYENVVTHVYSNAYQTPTITVTPVGIEGLSTSSIAPIFSYYRLYVEGEELAPSEFIVEIDGVKYVKISGITSSTNVGMYYVLAEVASSDLNFEGSAFAAYVVIRSALYFDGGIIPEKSIQYSENINSVDFGTVTVVNDDMGNYNRYFRGTIKVAVEDENGYVYDYFPEVTLSNAYNVTLIFTPNGDQSVQDDYNDNFRPFIVKYFLRVDKRDVSDTFQVEGLNRVFNNQTYTVTVTIPDPVNEGQFLDYEVEYLSDCKSAGDHEVKITLDETIPHYTGEKVVVMHIEKAPLTILDDEVTFVYNSQYVSYQPKWEVQITAYQSATFNFNLQYFDYLQNEAPTPIAVGRYYVEVELDDANFQATKMVTVLVEPDFRDGNGDEVFLNLTQTYIPPTSEEDIKAVIPGFNRIVVGGELRPHPSVNYTVTYKEEGSPSDNYSVEVPTEAGRYDVRVSFNERGYDLKYNLTMVIEKLNVESNFHLEPLYTRVYTGSEVAFAVALPDGVTVGSYAYREKGSNAEFSSVKPVNAGLYEVEITLIDNNYFGVGHTTLLIDKATPRIDNLPVLASTVPFSSNKEDVKFIEGSGLVVFTTTGEHLQGLGSWVVTTDIYTFRVGEHNVSVDFVPNDGQNFYNATTTVNIRIIERDISEYIGFTDVPVEDGVYSFEYIMDKIELHPYVKEEANIIDGYSNIKFEVLYGGAPTAPENVGEYSVKVVVSDPNHSGELSGITLKITHADPIVRFPELKPINLGEVLDDSYILSASGSAFIRSNGKIIQGKFSFRDVSKVQMNEANEQDVLMQFVPLDTANVQSVFSSGVTIKVIGNDTVINPEDVEITSTMEPVLYGAPLSVFDIKLVGTQPGTVKWLDPDMIPGVGETVKFVYTPFDTTVDNVMIIETTVNVLPAQMFLDPNATLNRVVVYEGSTIDKANVEISLLNAAYPTLSVEGYKATVSGSFSGSVGSEYVGKYMPSGVTVTITHPNYETFVEEFDVYVMREIKEFHVENLTKYYDGEEVTIEDLGISLIGGITVLDATDFKATSILRDGEEVSEIKQTGVYTVTVVVEEDSYVGEDGRIYYGSHAGTHTFTYTINKRDISSAMTIHGNETVYAEGSVRLEALFEGYVVDASTVVYTYYSSDRSISYNQLAPTNAGDYVVEVTLDNPYFTAQREFPYVVAKSTATITLDANYIYTYAGEGAVSPVNIVPIVSNNIDDSYLTFTYSLVGSNSAQTQAPTNAGTYNVTVSISGHKNIKGSAQTIVTILKASLTVTDTPQIGSITYGSALGNAVITGGRVESTTGAVEGTFAFQNPAKNDLPVGTQNVVLVFTPVNVNYMTVERTVSIVVNKANIGIEFGSLSAYYTGKPVYPTLTTNVNVQYTFRKDGLNVQNAVEVGIYTVTVTIVDNNYEGVAERSFQVMKARAIEDESVLPTVTPVTYGAVLSSGEIAGGSVVYVSGEGAVYGTWSYVEGSKSLGNVGLYDGVKIVFTPSDANNYEPYETEITVEVVKAHATMTVSANSFTYGSVILDPVFTTSPLNLKVANNEFETTMKNTVQRVGTYVFTAEIDDQNYEGSFEYPIVITKKTIEIVYYRGNVAVEDYRIPYGSSLRPDARIIADTMVDSDRLNVEKYQANILYTYTNVASGKTFITAPADVGEYEVRATITDNDYIIDTETNVIDYVIVKAEVSSIEFDANSLSNQEYGSVTIPSVLTTPSNVKYVVEFPGYERMPTNAGTYSIKVTITDPNYVQTVHSGMFRINPKPISAEELKAYNKAYDGLASIEVKGELKGVMNGDEVDITFIAQTRDGLTNVGTHSVVITGWELRGLHAANYTLRDPLYNLTAKITNKKIVDPDSQGYITSPDGFSNNITVSFKEVYDEIDQTTWFTRLLGQKASVQSITVKENGLNTVLETPVKFYVLIPEEFRDAKNLTYEGLGDLEGVTFTREENYITFYASTSGDIIFYKNDFPYWLVIAGGVVVMLILGVVFTLISAPVRKRKRVARPVRQAIEWNDSLEGREHAYKKKVEQELVEKKRRWRY